MVDCGDDFSSLASLVAGVPQDFPISLGFSLFIDEINHVLELSKLHMYTDDLQIYHKLLHADFACF
jgi:hypothetical protein